MKMYFIYQLEIDLNYERDRLKELFSADKDSEILNRQLAILDCLEKQDFHGMHDLYFDLPTSEKEFVGDWVNQWKKHVKSTGSMLIDELFRAGKCQVQLGVVEVE